MTKKTVVICWSSITPCRFKILTKRLKLCLQGKDIKATAILKMTCQP